MLAFAAPAQAQDAPESQAAMTGGAAYGEDPNAIPQLTVPGTRARLLEDGYAAAPADAPPEIQAAVWAANELQDKPYVYGGGHGSFEDDGYDCSGTVSYALRAAGVLDSPLDSGSFMRWGKRGKGDWITVYTNPGHAYVVIAGLRLDTSAAGDPSGL
jgi:cell wall-associated NlpC family hydrolase